MPVIASQQKEFANLNNSQKYVPNFDDMDFSYHPNSTDPVTLKVREMKAHNMNDSEIVTILELHDLHWDPKTGATYKGRLPAQDELARLPLQNSTTLNNNNIYAVSPMSFMGGSQVNRLLITNDAIYRGFYCRMKPGTLSTQRGLDETHIGTIHVGRTDLQGGHWLEVGVYRLVNPDGTSGGLVPFTYCDAHLGYVLHDGVTSVPQELFTPFRIEIGQYDFYNHGYPYSAYINNMWMRTEYLYTSTAKIDEANEAWSSSSYKSDSTWLVFKDNHLYTWPSPNEVSWNHNIASHLEQSPIIGNPIQYSLSDSSGTYDWETKIA